MANNKQYLDRDALLKVINNNAEMFFNGTYMLVECFPVARIEIVESGEWIERTICYSDNSTFEGNFFNRYKCSNCGAARCATTNYCSECGSKMKGAIK